MPKGTATVVILEAFSVLEASLVDLFVVFGDLVDVEKSKFFDAAPGRQQIRKHESMGWPWGQRSGNTTPSAGVEGGGG